ncbi:hypothetical protein JOD82_000359 [Paenibacillus sp. 1182]|nr:hypothetical protein [Paenibacillus sp. 1182]
MANELIVENGGRLGAPVPSIIRQAVEVLKSKSGEKEGGGENADKQKKVSHRERRISLSRQY